MVNSEWWTLISCCLAYCLLLIACCSLPVAHCLLLIAYCPLPIAHCLLPIAYCPLPLPTLNFKNEY